MNLTMISFFNVPGGGWPLLTSPCHSGAWWIASSRKMIAPESTEPRATLRFTLLGSASILRCISARLGTLIEMPSAMTQMLPSGRQPYFHFTAQQLGDDVVAINDEFAVRA